MDLHQKYVSYIERNIDDVCPYDDASRQRLYHIGFMQSLLARLMMDDNRNFNLFNKVIEELKHGSKE